MTDRCFRWEYDRPSQQGHECMTTKNSWISMWKRLLSHFVNLFAIERFYKHFLITEVDKTARKFEGALEYAKRCMCKSNKGVFVEIVI